MDRKISINDGMVSKLLSTKNDDNVYYLVLSDLDKREIFIVKKRMIEKLTLNEIASSLMITRERVRQILLKIIEKVSHKIKSAGVYKKLIEFLRESVFVDEQGIRTEINRLTNKKMEKDEIELLSEIFLRCLLFEHKIIMQKFGKNQKIFYLEEYKHIIKKIFDYFNELLTKDKKRINILLKFDREIEEFILKLFFDSNLPIRNFNLSFVKKFLWINYIKSLGLREIIYFILKLEGKPMHFTEITLKAEKLLNKSINERYIHNRLIEDAKFSWAGNGYYALSEWGYPPQAKEIIDVVLYLIEKNGRALTTEEIYEFILSKYRVYKNSIYMALKSYENKKVKRIGKKLWINM